MIDSHGLTSIDINSLKIRVDKALLVFNTSERAVYLELHEIAKSIWLEIGEVYTTNIELTELPKYIEMLTRLIPIDDYNALLRLKPIIVDKTLEVEQVKSIKLELSLLDDKLNTILNIKKSNLEKAWNGEYLPFKKVKEVSIKKVRDVSKKSAKTVATNMSSKSIKIMEKKKQARVRKSDFFASIREMKRLNDLVE